MNETKVCPGCGKVHGVGGQQELVDDLVMLTERHINNNNPVVQSSIMVIAALGSTLTHKDAEPLIELSRLIDDFMLRGAGRTMMDAAGMGADVDEINNQRKMMMN